MQLKVWTERQYPVNLSSDDHWIIAASRHTHITQAILLIKGVDDFGEIPSDKGLPSGGQQNFQLTHGRGNPLDLVKGQLITSGSRNRIP